MSSRYLRFAAVNADLLSDQDIRDITVPSTVSMAASSVTKTDQIGLRLNRTIILDDGVMNIEASADVVDVQRDRLVDETVIGPGVLRMPVPVLTTEGQVWIQAEPIV